MLDRAHLAAGETLLDVGCGEGLIGFGALERGAATVVFSDISSDLLALCREAATDLGVVDRCRFVEAAADDLAPVLDGSVDLVTTRSVLIYVKEKARAFSEFARVLRPGGRVSLYEPINRFAVTENEDGRFAGYDLRGLGQIPAKLQNLYLAIQPADDPMLDFDERDLVRLRRGSRFLPHQPDARRHRRTPPPRDWDGLLDTAGNPNIPTLREAMEEALTASEREQLTTHLRPLVEQGRGTWRMAHAFLAANKPDS